LVVVVVLLLLLLLPWRWLLLVVVVILVRGMGEVRRRGRREVGHGACRGVPPSRPSLLGPALGRGLRRERVRPRRGLDLLEPLPLLGRRLGRLRRRIVGGLVDAVDFA
jgi:hypothetical protein